MDWTKITDNAEVIKLLKQRTEIENKIKAIDQNALIMYELELLSIPVVVGRSEQFYCDGQENNKDRCETQCLGCARMQEIYGQ